jgi:glycerophosphoryl diester phosphodiesterase
VGAFEQKVIDVLAEYTGEFAVQAFNPYSLEYFRRHAPHILRGQLSCFFKGSDLSRIHRYLLKRLLLFSTARPNFIAYDFHNLPNRYVSRHKNVPVLAWTLTNQADADAVKPFCNNIIFQDFQA